MCCVIKLEINLNQSVIRFNKPTNTDSTTAPACHMRSCVLGPLVTAASLQWTGKGVTKTSELIFSVLLRGNGHVHARLPHTRLTHRLVLSVAACQVVVMMQSFLKSYFP